MTITGELQEIAALEQEAAAIAARVEQDAKRLQEIHARMHALRVQLKGRCTNSSEGTARCVIESNIVQPTPPPTRAMATIDDILRNPKKSVKKPIILSEERLRNLANYVKQGFIHDGWGMCDYRRLLACLNILQRDGKGSLSSMAAETGYAPSTLYITLSSFINWSEFLQQKIGVSYTESDRTLREYSLIDQSVPTFTFDDPVFENELMTIVAEKQKRYKLTREGEQPDIAPRLKKILGQILLSKRAGRGRDNGMIAEFAGCSARAINDSSFRLSLLLDDVDMSPVDCDIRAYEFIKHQ